MREILFRGKTRNGEWVFGDLMQVPKKDLYEIFPQKPCSSICAVVKETVGQYTGLTDKNGKKIFEGDIVQFACLTAKIVYEKGAFGLAVTPGINWDKNGNFVSLWEFIWNFEVDDYLSIEVIGNIYDNPELLEGE